MTYSIYITVVGWPAPPCLRLDPWQRGRVGPFAISKFRDKEAVLFPIKNYSIHRVVKYKVLESNHIEYHGKCKYLGNGCNWSICVTYRQKKKLWKIRKYNGPHACVSASLSQDHPQLDTNIFCATIYPMVQANLTISIKVL